MIAELLLIPIYFILFSGWGAWAKLMIGVKTDSFSLTVLSGFSFFGVLTCLLSFFTPLNLYIEAPLLIISIVPFLFKNLRIHTVRFPKELLQSVWFWIFCIIIISAGSIFPFRPDHFWYYEPTIGWLNQYGIVKGIANIDWSLGQMSVLHTIQAGIDQTIDPFHRICIFFTVFFLVYLFERKEYLLLLVIPLYFFFIQTSSPDVAICFISLIVVSELCFNYRIENYKILLFISVFAFTIKPVVFWLPIWVFIAGTYLNKKELKDYRIYLIPAVIIIIFLIKNIIASSTLLYPVSFTKLNTWWLPDLRVLELSDQRATAYTLDRLFTGDEVNKMSFFRKFYYWLSVSKLQAIINDFMTLTIVAFGFFSFMKKKFLYQSLWIIVVIKSFIVFSFSGQFRFMLEGIYPLLFIMLYSLRIGKIKIFIAGLSFSLLIFTLISYPPLLKRSIPSFKLTAWMNGFTKKSLLMPEHYVIKNYHPGKIGNLNFNITVLRFNYDTPPPAIEHRTLNFYYQTGIFPQMKDSANIRKGFYMRTLNPEEKESLGKIIDTYLNPKKSDSNQN